MLNNLTFCLVGFLWALMLADAALTLHGLESGQLKEGNKLVVWFTESPWRLYPLVIASCVLVYLSVELIGSVAPWLSVPVVLAPIWFRGKVVVHNYMLNLKVW